MNLYRRMKNAAGAFVRVYGISGTPTDGDLAQWQAGTGLVFGATAALFAGTPAEGDVLLYLDGVPTWVTPDTPIDYSGFGRGFADAFGGD